MRHDAHESALESLGTTVDDLVAVLARLHGYDVTGPLDSEVDCDVGRGARPVRVMHHLSGRGDKSCSPRTNRA